jgi:hypothetical protein
MRLFRSTAHRARSFVKRGAKPTSELCRIVVRPKMKEKKTWLFIQHVAVNRCHLDAV